MTIILELMDLFEVFVINSSNKDYFMTFCHYFLKKIGEHLR